MTYSQAFYKLANNLHALYDAQEATAIAHEVLLHITGLDRLQRLMQKDELFTEQQQAQFETIQAQLLEGTPLQYTLGVAWFMGHAFKVNEHTLIPRPETEELVQWIIDEQTGKNTTLLDVGTGSGCIPISLKLAIPGATVNSCDISTGALEVATENAYNLHAAISLQQLNFLDVAQNSRLATYDVLVSNPPYIPVAEREEMHKNVKDFEPAQALFVPDNDPLLFYRAIATFGKTHLSTGGNIYCELHRDFALQTKILFETLGYKDVLVRKDMHGNLRMLKAVLPG